MTRRLNIYQYNSKMSLRRKPASRRTSETGSVKASLYAYPDRDLEKDYIIWNSINGIKVGQCRHENTRQLVIVQEVKRISVSQFSRVLRIFHENIASPIFLYKSHIIYEFVDLEIVDVLPLSNRKLPMQWHRRCRLCTLPWRKPLHSASTLFESPTLG